MVSPLTIQYGDQSSTIELLHTSSLNEANEIANFNEKLEFILNAGQLDSILASGSVRLKLTTLLGEIVKSLSEEEMKALQRFSVGPDFSS